ncbi:MAG: UvrD-helicase domain-containing protein [Oceanospirillales bacterium]|nr:UvrD-helicase domain-containing protein [Oceanospirillales bacterium]
MLFYKHSNLIPSLIDLSKRGGPYRKAADQVDALLNRITRGEQNPLNGLSMTNNGETRIDNCIKYDLAGRCRLVTVQQKGRCLLLMVGDHEDADKWLDRHKGKSFGVNQSGQLVDIERPSEQLDYDNPFVDKRLRQNGPLFEKINEDLYDRLIEKAPRKVSRELERLTCYDEQKLLDAVSSVGDEDLRDTLTDVFVQLIAGDTGGAERRAMLYLGDIIDLSQIDPQQTIVDSEFLKRIGPDCPEYPTYLRLFAESGDYKEWMLFMHPDQEAIAFSDFNGPAKLIGVSGSGKTCIVVQRALYLSNKYPDEKILVVTLNRPLAQLIDELVTQLSEPSQRLRIEVKPFFSVCQALLHEFEPGNTKLYEDITWKSGEHIDEIWREYYRCELRNHDAEVMLSIHDSFIARGINAEHYIREEFDWIRSALPKSQRDKYLSIEREGRTIPLQAPQRKLLLAGLAGWEKKMRDIGVTDYLNISTALHEHLNNIKPSYRCILIDESQDFGNIEFEIARRLVNNNENDLFICGDAAQQVSTKYQKLKEANIDLHGSRSRKIIRNYRNSREILEAAHHVLHANLPEDMLTSNDFEILDPEYASFSGAVPVILEAPNLEQEIGSAFSYLKTEMNSGQKACIALAGFSLREVEQFAKRINVPVLNGNTGLGSYEIFLSDLEQTKGFEFDYMCILNCSEHVIPNPQVPAEEHFRELSRLYVAMTRAKLELIVSFSAKPSSLFSDSEEFFYQDLWSNYIEGELVTFGVPDKLAETVNRDDMPSSPLEMTGAQFLYRFDSIGFSSELIQLLRERVDGKGLISGQAHSSVRRRVKWKTVGALIQDIKTLNAVDHKVPMALSRELVQATEKYGI